MMTHHQVWHGIERLAERNGLSASGLARKAGLDPTTFNRSKRITRQGKLRWPSTESLAKILEATSTPLEDFVAMMTDEIPFTVRGRQRLPSIAFADATSDDAFDGAGYPIGDAWEEVDFPHVDDPHAYAVELRGESLSPGYREGDMFIVSPSASVRRHDRVLLRLRTGGVVGGVLKRQNAQRVVLVPFDQTSEEATFAIANVAWMARIVWVSQ